jgi:Aldo/keto reductase family
MPLDHYVTLGQSGLRVSPLCLGAMTFGEDLGWGSSVEESQQIIDRFVDLGGNFIDTANFYTKSHSEKIIGDHIGRHPARRDRLVIATKFSGNLYPGDPNGGGSGRKSLINACENSLRRLQTDYIDLYWLHIWDSNTPIEETMEDRRGQPHRPFPRMVVLHRAADRVLAAATDRRTGTGSHGRRIRPRDHAMVTARRGCAQRQVHTTQRR